MIASRVQQQEKEEGIVYHCKECKYIAETEREATEHEKDKHNSRPCCTVVIKESIKARLREYIRRYWEAKREEAKHSNKRRREREYKEFKDKVYEAFTTFAVRYYSYARSSGALEWNANMLYQFLDNEPISRHDPELATLTWQSLLLLTIPTFPSNRDNGIKVHVIAVEVLQKTNSNQIIAHRRLLKQTIAERISSKYEIDAVTHMVFALEATNNTCNIIDSSDTNIINNEPDKVLQSRPLFSNYVNQEGRLKRLVVGDTRHSLVFVGNNVYDKLLDAMHILSCFYASKSAGMLHDSSLTNKAALKSIMLQRSLQNYYSIRYYGSMDDMYTSKARSETIMNSTLLRHTFLRLLSALIALKEVMKPQIEKLKRYMLEVVGRLTEAIRDIHAKAVQQEVNPIELTYISIHCEKEV